MSRGRTASGQESRTRRTTSPGASQVDAGGEIFHEVQPRSEGLVRGVFGAPSVLAVPTKRLNVVKLWQANGFVAILAVEHGRGPFKGCLASLAVVVPLLCGRRCSELQNRPPSPRSVTTSVPIWVA